MVASLSDTMYSSDGKLSSGCVKFMVAEVGVRDSIFKTGERRPVMQEQVFEQEKCAIIVF